MKLDEKVQAADLRRGDVIRFAGIPHTLTRVDVSELSGRVCLVAGTWSQWSDARTAWPCARGGAE